MPKLYIYECSKCKRREESTQQDAPNGWAHALVTYTKYSQEYKKELDWCEKCWGEIVKEKTQDL